MKRSLFTIAMTVVLTISASACGANDKQGATSTPAKIKVVTHDSFGLSTDVLADFEKTNNAKVEIVKQGDAGEMLNKVVLAASNQLGDVAFGIDNTYLTRAISSNVFDDYTTTKTSDIKPEFLIDTSGKFTPVDHGEVCVDYDKKWFAEKQKTPPTSFEDLTKPEFKNLTVVPSAATSSTGLSFFFGTIAHFGDTTTAKDSKWATYWSDLKRNGVSIVGGWEQAYNTSFTGGPGKGDRPIVISYSSSPPAAVADMPDPKPTESPIGVVSSTCFQQIEFAGVLKGTKQPDLARKFVDFMVSKQVQNDIPSQMYMYPVTTTAQLPDVWARYSVAIPKPLRLEPKWIADNREKSIEVWTQITSK